MTEQAPEPTFESEPTHYEGGARRKRRRVPGCVAVVLAIVVLLGGFTFAVVKGKEFLENTFATAEDYPGPGTGEVMFEVEEGDTITEMGQNLKDQDVVASVDAFVEAAGANPDAKGIQVGYYPMRKEMAATDAVEVLVDPDNLISASVTVPEGLQVKEILDILAEETDYSKAAYQQALSKPKRLGLPDYAPDNAEGYLFPSTYDVGPKDKPADILKKMVDRWKVAAEEAGLEQAADDLGYSPGELMTIASMIEAEGRGDYMPKISRVIYNRLENPDNGVTNGLLQIDATVNYALGRSGVIAVTQAEIDQVADSPYNTYQNPGLPPGPIEAPGDDAIQAATHPEDGDWLFYVTTNLKTGETKFTDSYDEFLVFKAEYKEYCDTSDAC